MGAQKGSRAKLCIQLVLCIYTVIDCCCCYVQIGGNLVQYYNMFMNVNYFLGCLYDAGFKIETSGHLMTCATLIYVNCMIPVLDTQVI